MSFPAGRAGKLEQQLAAAVGELDGLKIGLQHLDHDFKHAGFCKASALEELHDAIEAKLELCQV